MVDATIATCTSCCEPLFRLPAERLIGRRMADLGLQLVDEDGSPVPAVDFPLDRANKDGSASRFIVGLQAEAGGETCWLSATLKPGATGDQDTALAFLTLADVTGLVQERLTNSQIFQAKSEWETTVDALQDIVTIQDTEMRIVRANKAAHDLFGYRLGELKGRRCYEVFFKRPSPCDQCPLVETARDGSPHIGTMYNPMLDRTFSVSSFPIFAQSGKMHLLVHVARDVTQYLQNESEKNRLMAAIEQASESVVISTDKGVIQYVNPAFENSTGYTRAEAIGRNLNILKSGVHDRQFYETMWQTLLAKQVWRGRLTNRRKNGTLFKEDATISPVLDSSGEIINYVALKRDVTREELLEQQLHQAMKMEALGTLAGGIAHDFNNILAAMIGYGEMAKDRLTADHPASKDIDQVLAGGDRAVDLVKQILTFSKQESSGQFRLFKVQYIVKEVIKLLRPSLPAPIELVHDIDNSCRSIFADPGQIYQVLMNLCTNARQAIGEDHGRITIRLLERQATEDRAKSHGEVAKSGTYLDLEVTDSGCGIEEEMLAKIFDPFYTTKKNEQGTGLGLAVVHGIVKKHKGEIQVISTVGVGTTFHVYLAVDGREVDTQKRRIMPVRGGNERIMVIDDEVPVTEVLRASLEDVGYLVETFHDSIAAVRRFRENPCCCDLVLTDMQMPGMTGAEMAREFLALRPDLPIIMLTGHSENFDVHRAKMMGIRELIQKPAKKEKLQQIVRKVLEHGKDIDH
jgi:PAS domain S-box-containing protein